MTFNGPFGDSGVVLRVASHIRLPTSGLCPRLYRNLERVHSNEVVVWSEWGCTGTSLMRPPPPPPRTTIGP